MTAIGRGTASWRDTMSLLQADQADKVFIQASYPSRYLAFPRLKRRQRGLTDHTQSSRLSAMNRIACELDCLGLVVRLLRWNYRHSGQNRRCGSGFQSGNGSANAGGSRAGREAPVATLCRRRTHRNRRVDTGPDVVFLSDGQRLISGLIKSRAYAICSS